MKRHTANNPCPICGGFETAPRGQSSRCHGFLSDDEKFCHCSREEFSGGLQINMDSQTYAHILTGSCLCGKTHGTNGHTSNRNGNNKPVKIRPTKLVKTWDYKLDNAIKYQIRRMKYTDAEGGKTYWQCYPDGNGGYIFKDVFQHVKRILYNLDSLNNSDVSRIIFFTEGEKAADALIEKGLLATTNSGGAGKFHLGKENHTKPLRNRSVIILPDNDEQGIKHGQQVAKALTGIAASIRVVTLPNLQPKGDVYDWFEAGNSVEELKQIATSTPQWKPAEEIPEPIDQPTTTQTLPHDHNAERKVIGCMILDTSSQQRSIDQLIQNDFSHGLYAWFFKVICVMVQEGTYVDKITLNERLSRDKKYNPEIISHIDECLQSITNSALIDSWIEVLKEKSIRRFLVTFGQEIKQAVYERDETGEKLLAEFQSKLRQFDTQSSSGISHIGKDIDEVLDVLQERQQRLKKQFQTINPYDTGLAELNKHFGGFDASWLVILAGDTGLGKTALALSMCRNMHEEHPVLFFSHEMNKTQIQERIIANQSQTNTKSVMTKEDTSRLFAGIKKVRDFNIWIDDSCPNISQIESRVHRFVDEHEDKQPIVFVDYLQLVTNPGKSERHEKVSDMSRRLKLLANRLQIPIVCLSQLTKESLKNNKKPSLGDLRESGAMAQDADLVLILWAEKSFEQVEKEHNSRAAGNEILEAYPVTVIQAKARHADSNIEYELGFQKKYTKFVDYFGEGEPPF